MRAKIALRRAGDTFQPCEFQLLAPRQRLQCGYDFQAHRMMNRPRVKAEAVASLPLTSARPLGKGSSLALAARR